MTLTLYFFRQFIPPFAFGTILFASVLILDEIFDLIDLIFNKGVGLAMVLKILLLYFPTILPLTLPMAFLLACLVLFGRFSEENEITAVRAGGIPLQNVIWIIPLFALMLSFLLVPFNTRVVPWSNRAFRNIYEQIVHADPLVNIEPRKFFSIKNTKIFAESIDPKTKELKDVFVYKTPEKGGPMERIFARTGVVTVDKEAFQMKLMSGQMQRFNKGHPEQMIHTAFSEYRISVPLKLDKKYVNTRFRNLTNKELTALIKDLKKNGLPSANVEAERSLRYAIAFAPFCLVLLGIPLATVLKKGGKTFGFGITIVVIFLYYLLLIFGLTLAEKAVLPAYPSLWIANCLCLGIAIFLSHRMLKT